MTTSVDRRYSVRALGIIALSLVGFVGLPQPTTAAEPPSNAPFLRLESGGHTDIVRGLAFTADGRYLISAGDDKAARVWDVADPVAPRLVRTLHWPLGTGPAGKINAVAFAPPTSSGARAVVALGGIAFPAAAESWGDIVLLDFETGDILVRLRGHAEPIAALAFSADGRYLASASGDGVGRIWELDRVERPLRLAGSAVLTGHQGPVYGLAFLPGPAGESPRLVSAGDDKQLRIWRRESSERWSFVTTLVGHDREVTRVAPTPDGRKLVSASLDRSVRLWSPATSTSASILAETEMNLTALAVSPDGQYVVAGGARPFTCRVWKLSDAAEVSRFASHTNTVQTLAVHPAGRIVASAGGDGHEIFLWDLQSGREMGRIRGTGRSVVAVAFSDDGTALAFGHTNKGLHLTAQNPLERSFEFGDLVPGPDVHDDNGRHRATLEFDGWTARIDRAELTVLHNGATQTKIALPQTDDRIRCYSFAKGAENAPVVIVGSVYGLRAYDAISGRPRREFVGHSGEIWAVAVSPDGRLLASASGDQTCRLWNRETGELLLSLFCTDDRQWVAWTPAGYYAASGGGDKLIGWQLNQGLDRAPEFFFAWQYRSRFHRPEVVRRVLETLNVDAAVAAAELDVARPANRPSGLAGELAQFEPPTVEILEPAPDFRTTAERVRLQVRVTAHGSQPLSELVVRLDGRPLEEDARRGGKNIRREKLREGTLLDREINLPPGEHEISVFAKSETAVGLPAVVRVIREATRAPGPAGKLYVLAIGVSNYADASLNLSFADADAREVAAVFDPAGKSTFPIVEKKVLLNQEADRDAIIEAFAWLADSVTTSDMAFVMISGHGLRDKRGKYFFVPHDFQRERISSTGVPWSAFQDTLTSLPCKVVLAMDTCHSGPIRASERSRDVVLSDELRDLTGAEGNVVVLSSSTGKEVSWEKPAWRHGAFALALIEGLTSQRRFLDKAATPLPADVNGDGLVHLNELDVYVTNRVIELTDDAQHPTTDRCGTSFPLTRTAKP